ncbi:uncharacterized protein [Diadema setosum]|uniref:uncharacterized protein n=1 Tax=Diadema setosum TaxID=31175 RepID=UPI003B3B345A
MASPCWRISCLLSLAVAVAILISASAKPLKSGEHALSPSDVQYYTTSPDYDFVKPVRLGTKHRRAPEEESVTSTLEFYIEGFERLFHLQLLDSAQIFNAGLVVKRIGADGRTRLEQPSKSCYYQGFLVGQEESSSASVSTCNGLSGMIKTAEGTFGIKPLKDIHSQLVKGSDDVDTPTHIMYKMDSEEFSSKSNTEGTRPKNTQRRERREISGPKLVETYVVADNTMFDTYGSDTEFYLFNILNQVAGLFQDSTLSPELKLQINGITILESPQTDLDLTNELSHSLKNFCEWQKDHSSDISVLLTRLNLQIGGNSDVTGKASDVGGACDPSRRCVIAQDHGPSGAIFTLAHEMGHSLGMYHDDADSGCYNNGNIMASGNSGGTEAFQWSQCSRNDLGDFLSSPESECLDNTNNDVPVVSSESVVMPGYFYDASQQCRLTFGPEAVVAEGYIESEAMCAELQCQLPGSSEPVTNHVPALDGTKCGSGKRQICVHGQCLKVFSLYDCNGGECVPEWLPGNFGSCQSDCYRYRSIFCVERHDDGTTILVSDQSRCPAERPAEREYCCDPVSQGEAEFRIISSTCSVTCGTGTATRVVACVDIDTDQVVDDSLCSDTRPDATAQCALDPCPGVTYVLFYDNYGECSVTCGGGTQTRNAFCSDSSGNPEAVSVCAAVFPSVVTQQSCNTQACQGTVVTTYSYSTTAFGACSVTCGQGVQTRSVFCVNDQNVVVDDANCASLQRPATTQICNLAACPQTYRYVTTSYSACSETCGVGVRTRSVFCLDESNQVISSTFCENQGLTAPQTAEACQEAPCEVTYRYEADDFPECTATCGTQVVTREVVCVSSDGDAVVNDTFCEEAGLTVPDRIQTCILPPCGNFQYTTGEYGPCSATCGVGVQQRSVVCVDVDNGNAVVADSFCQDERPVSAVICNDGDCPSTFDYLTSRFSECSCEGIQTRFVVCISYQNGIPVQATEEDCQGAGLTRPASSQACTVPVTCIPVWQVGEWSECSVTCGIGVQTRDVFCIESEGSSVLVDPSLCDADNVPATVQICNTQVDCGPTYTWVAESFGECSVTCGAGVRQRNVFCYAVTGVNFEIVDGSLCVPGEEPPSEEICELDPCGGVYEASAWSACSVTCANGVQTRNVTCVTSKGSGVELDESECNMTRPSESRECYLAPCPLPYGCGLDYLVEGTTSYSLESPNYPTNYPADQECSKFLEAPEGSRIRIQFTDFLLEGDCYDRVMLIDRETGSIERLCGAITLPYDYQSSSNRVEVRFITDATVSERGFTGSYQAVPEEGPQYVTGEWGECSVTCGEGVERRDITCVQDGEEVDEMECLGLPRPSGTRPCVQPDCPPPGACDENILRREAGMLTSPGFPSAYPANLTCTNTIRAPLGKVVRFTVDFFSIGERNNCTEGDAVIFKDVTSEDEEYVCGSVEGPEIFTSLTNEVSVVFVSDDVDNGEPGFSVSFTFEDPDPAGVCGENIELSGQYVYSPGYPGNYEDNAVCITTITNPDGCLALSFVAMDINNGVSRDENCMEDFLLLEDVNNPTLRATYCSDEAPLEPWLSASGDVRVTFISNQFNTSDGYLAVPRFVECPQAFWVPLEYGNCSASCGEGNRTRELECRSALTNELVDPSECPDERPVTTIPCQEEECPSCDGELDSGNAVYRFPFENDRFEFNDECRLTITNAEGCVNLFFLSLDIDESRTDGECGRDSVLVFDPENMYANQPFCDSGVPSRYLSLGNSLQVVLRNVDADRYKSFEIFPSFVACPTHAYKPGPWSECSASCGGGTRTRDVVCTNLQTDQPADDAQCANSAKYDASEECNAEECPECYQRITEQGIFVSPGFDSEGGYYDNQDCLFEVENPDSDGCVTISFNSFDLGPPSRACDDFVEILDLSTDRRMRFCGQPNGSVPTPFSSRGPRVNVTFTSDDTEEDSAGFEAFVTFDDCPLFGYVAGNFSECSVTCGEGVVTRTVECQRLSNGERVDDELCQDMRPEETRRCRRRPCPSCDEVLTSIGVFRSPNSPREYDNNLDCDYYLRAPEDQCLRVTFISNFEFGEGEDEECEDDYIELSDDNWEYLDQRYCGDETPPVWRSRTSNATLTFRSDEEDTYLGFTAYLAFVSCPEFGFTVGEFSECDVTCGRGERTRDVTCVNLRTGDVQDDSRCTDPRPEATEECRLEPCPSCDATFTEDGTTLSATSLEADQTCVFNVTALDGRCLRTFVLSWHLSDYISETECSGDSLTFIDAEYPHRVALVCGENEATPLEIVTYGSTGLVVLDTDDDANDGSDYQIYVQFTECQEFGFTVGEYGECSATCGGGVQYREVNCTRLATGESVSFDNCDDIRATEYPGNSRPCNTESCPFCYTYQNDTSLITSPNYPNDYPPNTVCFYELENLDGCWSLQGIDLDIAGFFPFECYDGLAIQDLEYPSVDLYVACGDEIPPESYKSLSGHVLLTFYSNETAEGRGFAISPSLVECPQYAYLPGPSSECSVTCGWGVRTREIFCTDLANNVTVNSSFCAGQEGIYMPPPTLPCYEGECPSCDLYVNATGEYIYSPNYPDNYDNNQQCTVYILSPDPDMCINLFFISLELEGPGNYTGCFETDYLSVVDALMEEPPYYDIDFALCGSEENILWTSRTSFALLTLTTNAQNTFDGYQIYASTAECNNYFYGVTPWSECSVSCGLGERVRNTSCVDRSDNYTLVSDDLCGDQIRPITVIPCYDAECPSCDRYINTTNENLQPEVPYSAVAEKCSYEYVNTEGGCHSLVFISIDLPERNEDGECDRDYLVYEEEGNYSRTIIICGDNAPSITSRSSEVTLTLVTDGVVDEGFDGFRLANGFVPCPQYGFVADEEFGECDVTCGGGFRSRNVTCIDLSDGMEVADQFCSDARPMEFLPCNEEPCPTCDQYINETSITITSPGYGEGEYEANLNCRYLIDYGSQCVRLTFLNFGLQMADARNRCRDYLEISDQAVSTDHLTQQYCGDGPGQFSTWDSRSSEVELTFVTDGTETPGSELGFELFLAPIECPMFGFVYSNFSECSVSCGEGMQTRDVSCVNLNTNAVVDDSQCPETPPEATASCNLGECPSCDRSFNVTQTIIAESSHPYPSLANCVDTFTSSEGICVALSFILLRLENSMDCINDSLTVADPNNEDISFTFCGAVVPVPSTIYSTSNQLTITLISNEAVEDSGYQVVVGPRDCPNVTWVAENVGGCSVTCGSGVQQRNVYCLDQNTGLPFSQEESCPGDRPDDTIPCSFDPCPQECSLVYTNQNDNQLTSPGYPNHLYENDLECSNIVINYAGCIAITVLEIDIEPSENCDKDYLMIADSSMPQLGIRLCGNELPTNNLWVSSAISPTSVGLFTDGENRYPGYNLTFSFLPCPRQGFTVGMFGECSATCGVGVVTRDVTCQDSQGNTLGDEQCYGQRPLSAIPCELDPCSYSYNVSEWSECSATCGSAIQTRTVECLADNTTVVNSSLCENYLMDIPPVEERACNLTDCPVYRYVTFPTSACSVTCGLGTMGQRAFCRDQDGNIDPTGMQCSGPVPPTSVPCIRPDCPVYGWEVSAWGVCSVTCGSGIQTRNVTCQDQDNVTVSDSNCGGARPNDTQVCSLDDCPAYSYRVGNFSECSVTCGDGVQTRNVSCYDDDGNEVDDSFCVNQTAPDTTQACNDGDCVIANPTCGDAVNGSSVLEGNLTSPGFPGASPANLSCPIVFIPPQGYFLVIVFDVYDLDKNCGERVTFTGDQSGFYDVCQGVVVTPINLSFTADSMVTMEYITDDDLSNTPVYSGTWRYVQSVI